MACTVQKSQETGKGAGIQAKRSSSLRSRGARVIWARSVPSLQVDHERSPMPCSVPIYIKKIGKCRRLPTSPSWASQRVSSPERLPALALVPSVQVYSAQSSPSPIWPWHRCSFDADPLQVTLLESPWSSVLRWAASSCGSWSHSVLECPSAGWKRRLQNPLFLTFEGILTWQLQKQQKKFGHNMVHNVLLRLTTFY